MRPFMLLPGGMQVVDPHSKALLSVLHLSVQTGRPVLLERLQTQIDPSLEPLITKNIVVVNGTHFIRIGKSVGRAQKLQ